MVKINVIRRRRTKSIWYLWCSQCNKWAPFGSGKPTGRNTCTVCGTRWQAIEDKVAHPNNGAREGYAQWSVVDNRRDPKLLAHLMKLIDPHLNVRDL